MKSITGLIVLALVMAVAGLVALGASRVQQHLADAQQQASTLQFDAAEESLAAADRYLAYGTWIPSIGAETAREVAARRAAIQYWRGDYEGLLPAGDPVASVDETNTPLQLVVANAVFRNSLSQAKARADMIQALEEAAAGYQTVLRGDTFHGDAAFNYEYAIRLRDMLARGQRPPEPKPEPADLGQSGAPAPETKSEGFEIYIPLESQEKAPTGGDAGKASANDRKG